MPLVPRLLTPDGSRDARIDDPSNLWLIHPAGRLLLPITLRLRIPANAVSLAGFAFGAAAAYCYSHWQQPGATAAGFALSVAWLVADGLDGMIARATGTASAFGRFLDGVCDHFTFLLIYVALAWSLDSAWTYVLASVAGLVHGLQATLFEGERARFHRRIAGDPGERPPRPANVFVRAYDALAGSLDRLAAPFDALLAGSRDRLALGDAYGRAATPPLSLLALLSNNVRVLIIWLACLAGEPAWFWWLELGPLSLVAIIGIVWHRRVEAALCRSVNAGMV